MMRQTNQILTIILQQAEFCDFRMEKGSLPQAESTKEGLLGAAQELGLISSCPGEEIWEWKLALGWLGKCYVCLVRRGAIRNGGSSSKDRKVMETVFFISSLPPLGIARRTAPNERQVIEH